MSKTSLIISFLVSFQTSYNIHIDILFSEMTTISLMNL